jgi:hypothetical protein
VVKYAERDVAAAASDDMTQTGASLPWNLDRIDGRHGEQHCPRRPAKAPVQELWGKLRRPRSWWGLTKRLQP